MKSFILIALTLGCASLTNTIDNFTDIPIAGTPNDSKYDPHIIENSNKTFSIELKKGKSFKELVKDALYDQYLKHYHPTV